mmetsp:Transcript_6370/g.12802  ORF Transcript_6370/g.12802 Transcript_6370/m.12802 type:complete len:131 (+) Transcript_6370:109-501(+)
MRHISTYLPPSQYYSSITNTQPCKNHKTHTHTKTYTHTSSNADIPECSGGDKIRLICMGKGILMPDTKTLESAEVPIFQTHPTPVNVSVKPESFEENTKGGRGSPKKSSAGGGGGGESGGSGGSGGVECK